MKLLLSLIALALSACATVSPQPKLARKSELTDAVRAYWALRASLPIFH
jgi:hypothetical protein